MFDYIDREIVPYILVTILFRTKYKEIQYSGSYFEVKKIRESLQNDPKKDFNLFKRKTIVEE